MCVVACHTHMTLQNQRKVQHAHFSCLMPISQRLFFSAPSSAKCEWVWVCVLYVCVSDFCKKASFFLLLAIEGFSKLLSSSKRELMWVSLGHTWLLVGLALWRGVCHMGVTLSFFFKIAISTLLSYFVNHSSTHQWRGGGNFTWLGWTRHAFQLEQRAPVGTTLTGFTNEEEDGYDKSGSRIFWMQLGFMQPNSWLRRLLWSVR